MGSSRQAGPVRTAYTTDQFNNRVKGTGGAPPAAGKSGHPRFDDEIDSDVETDDAGIEADVRLGLVDQGPQVGLKRDQRGSF